MLVLAIFEFETPLPDIRLDLYSRTVPENSILELSDCFPISENQKLGESKAYYWVGTLNQR